MRWFVETSAIGKSDPIEKVCIEAAGWQQALQDVRARRGDEGSFASFSIELLDDGYRAIDPATRTRFVITRAPDDAPVDAGNGAKPGPASAAPATASQRPATTRSATEAPRAKPRVSIPDDVVPARADTPRPGATASRSAPPPGQRASQPPANGPTRILVAHRIASERAIEPTAERPLTYRELALVVADGTSHEEVEALLRSRFEAVRRTLTGKKGRYVLLAVFDHDFEGKPRRLPIATLSWKDWRGEEPELSFAMEEAPASVVANLGLHGLRRSSQAPPRPEAPAPSEQRATEVPSTVPRSPDSIQRAAAAMAGEDEPTIVRPEPPPMSEAVPLPARMDDVTVVRPSEPPPHARPSRPGAPPTVRSAPPAAPEGAAGGGAPDGVAVGAVPVAPRVPAIEEAIEVEVEESATPAMVVARVPSTPPPAPPPRVPSTPPQANVPSSPPPARIPSTPPAVASAPPPAASAPPTATSVPPQPSLPPRETMTPPAAPQGERVRGDELLAELFEASGDLELLADPLEGADFVLELALSRLPCEAGIVSFFEMNRREFVIVRQRGGAHKALLSSLPEKSEHANRAMRSGHAVLFSAPPGDDNRWRAMGVAPTSAICAPVKLGGRYLGLLEIANPRDGAPLDDADANALDFLGQQLAEYLGKRSISIEADKVTRPPLRARMR